jgi:hypothetical protein
MIKQIIFFILLVANFFISETIADSHCTNCQKIYNELQNNLNELNRSKTLLEQNEKALAQISPSDTSKRVKISSNLFILKTKLETLENNRVLIQKSLNEKNCSDCDLKSSDSNNG